MMMSTNLMKLCSKLWVLCIIPSLPLGQVSAPVPKTGADEAATQSASQNPAPRALVGQYFAAYARKDLDALTALWSSQSPDLAAHRQSAQQFFAANDKIVVSNMAIAETKIEGDKARLRVQVEMSSTDVKTGKTATDKSVRIFECVKEAGTWKVWHEMDAVVELAISLVAAKSEMERTALLERNKELVSPILIEALRLRAVGLSNRGEYGPALSVYETAQGIATTISDQRGVCRVLMGIGYLQMATGRYPEALRTYRRSLDMSETLDDRLTAGQITGFMGYIYLHQGNYSLALEQTQKSLRISESLGNKRGMAIGLLNVGNVYIAEHKSAQALQCYSKALALAEETNYQTLISSLLGQLGSVHQQLGDRAQALEYYQKSLALDKTMKDKRDQVPLLNNIGNVYMEQNDYAEALSHYQQSLEEARKVGDKLAIADADMNAGTVYRVQGDFDKALQRYHEALALYLEMENKGGQALFLEALGNLYSSQNDHAQAFVYYDKSLKLSQELGEQPQIAKVLIEMANARYVQKNFADGLDLEERASKIATEINDRDVLWHCYWVAGQTYQALHKPDEARVAFDEAITAVERLREDVAGGEEQQQSFFADKSDPYHGIVGLLVAQSQFSEALSYAERAKGRTLLDVLGSGRVKITKAMTGTEREREEDLEAQLVSLNRQLEVEKAASKPDAGHMAELKSDLEKTRLQYSDFRTNLYAAHPELLSQRGQIQPLSLSDAAGLLPDNHSAILEFVVAEERTYLFVLTQSTSGNGVVPDLKVYTIDINTKDLGQETEQFRRQLSLRDLNVRASAHQLYDLLLKPVQQQLAGKNALIIVPDGPLWNLPFQALERSNHYIVEKYAIAYAPSLTVLREMMHLRQKKQEQVSPEASTLLAMADPVLGTESLAHATIAYRGEKLGPLPEARQEVQALKRLYSGSHNEVYTGAEAREDFFKSEAGKFRILHLATHGILDNASPMYSNVLLSPGDTGKEDGLLEAREIMDLDLHADLAVLSACETARGRISAGEGVIGLSWAFFVAGTSTTVVSQWKVESTSTTELMLAFHRARKANEQGTSPFGTARALQSAELKLLHNPKFSDPVYWAGFIVVGDPQ
jgi:CHAT domain-containing protein/predicted negative regulator of RcsB-dependent stress response